MTKEIETKPPVPDIRAELEFPIPEVRTDTTNGTELEGYISGTKAEPMNTASDGQLV